MGKKTAADVLVISITVFVITTAGCGKGAAELSAIPDRECKTCNESSGVSLEMIPISELSVIFATPVTAKIDENSIKNDTAEIDTSDTKDGYIRVRYLRKTNNGIRVIVTGPVGTQYIYRLRSDGEYEVFPLSEGDGYYQITVYENVFGNKYRAVLNAVQSIELSDEFAPFTHPNQYVNYNGSGKAAEKAAELTKDSKNTIEKIEAIYNYVIKNIVYDEKLAADIHSGYIPDVDRVLENGKGICFDYAAVTAAMLRSQKIPAKLVVGYKGESYHAWISAYSDEAGWVNGIIFFDGKHWRLMDPTFSSNQDEDNYCAKYFY